ncbi:hypothetical protein DIPPA_18190 [Diplonema papillatum]|nr:hypothetical protein DIPPA_18190 [Diplonema papillatum]
MAQYGRRMRMRRLYDDASPDGHGDTSVVSEGYTSSVSPYPAPPPSVANGPDLASMESVIRHTVESGYKAGDSQFESVANDLTKRVKSMEDKSMMIDTTTRRMLSEAERVRSKLLEVEADVQKSVAELTSGLERSFRGASDSRREAEAVKEWTVGYVNAQVNSSEQATRASLAAESEGVSQKVKRNQELIASLGEQLETSLSLTADRLKASVNDSKVAVQARLTDFEARIQSAAKRADTIEARLTDALEIGLVREKNSRERAVAEVEKMVHHAVQVCRFIGVSEHG